MKASEEVRKLDGKEGSFTDLARQYLDAKKVNYSILKPEAGDNVVRIKGVEPFIEPGAIMIEKNGKKVILEELTKVCGVSGRYHDTSENVKTHAILDKAPKVLFRTHRDEKSLYIYTEAEIKEPTYGLYLGGGKITTDIKDALKEPSKIPEHDETFEINCKCDEGRLKCKGHVWQW